MTASFALFDWCFSLLCGVFEIPLTLPRCRTRRNGECCGKIPSDERRVNENEKQAPLPLSRAALSLLPKAKKDSDFHGSKQKKEFFLKNTPPCGLSEQKTRMLHECRPKNIKDAIGAVLRVAAGFWRVFLRYGRSLVRFYVLWRIIRAPRQGFRHIFCALFACPRYIVYMLRQGFWCIFGALRQVLKFFCAFFVFEGGFARFGAILAKRRRREKANSEKTSPIRRQKTKKRRRREKSQRQRKGKRKSQRQRKGEREKRGTKSDAPL